MAATAALQGCGFTRVTPEAADYTEFRATVLATVVESTGASVLGTAVNRTFVTSTVVATELLYGARRSADPERLRRQVEWLLNLASPLAFDEAAASHAADVRAELAAAGSPIGSYDTLIAGHARSRGLVVVTQNLKDFERVPGLRCTDWS